MYRSRSRSQTTLEANQIRFHARNSSPDLRTRAHSAREYTRNIHEISSTIINVRFAAICNCLRETRSCLICWRRRSTCFPNRHRKPTLIEQVQFRHNDKNKETRAHNYRITVARLRAVRDRIDDQSILVFALLDANRRFGRLFGQHTNRIVPIGSISMCMYGKRRYACMFKCATDRSDRNEGENRCCVH